ncbi:MAG: ADP-ribosylation factor-like protein [Candidatus Helarchaeota archaeon]
MSSKIKLLLNVKSLPKDPKTLLNLEVSALKDCSGATAKELEEKGIKKISDLIKVENVDDFIPKKGKKKDVESTLDLLTMEKFVTAARIIKDFVEGKHSEEKKLVVAGLDAAGKSSIIHKLMNPTEETKDEKPTLGLVYENFDLFGYSLTFFDFGGQELYRNQYIANPEQNFGETDLFVYVIDISAKKRIQESLDYLAKIGEIYKYLEETPVTVICLHKSDLVNPKDQAKMKQSILPELKKVLGDVRFSTHTTSVFDFNSLFSAFSEGFREISPVNVIIQKILGNFKKKIEASYIAFFNGTGICLAEDGEGKSKDLMKNFAFNIILGEELNVFPENAMKIVLMLKDQTYCILERIEIKKKDKFFLAWTSKAQPDILSKETLINEMEPWIQNFF